MKRNSILASGAALTLFATVLAQGCSSDADDPETTTPPLTGQGGTGGQVGSGNGGTAPVANGGTGGTAPVGNGGTGAAQGGTGGVASGMGGSPAAQGGTGGAAGMGGTGSGAPTACVGSISDGSQCTATCIDGCGVWNVGTRLCTCTAGIADCASCGFANPNDPLIIPPTMPLPGCVNAAGVATGDDAMEDLADTAGYTCMENARCTPMGEPTRYCACRANDWDCDSKPSSFGAN